MANSNSSFHRLTLSLRFNFIVSKFLFFQKKNATTGKKKNYNVALPYLARRNLHKIKSNLHQQCRDLNPAFPLINIIKLCIVIVLNMLDTNAFSVIT